MALLVTIRKEKYAYGPLGHGALGSLGLGVIGPFGPKVIVDLRVMEPQGDGALWSWGHGALELWGTCCVA